MKPTLARRLLRAATAGRAAYGLFLLAMPRRLLAAGALERTPGWAPGIVRLLGARHLLQAAAIAARPGLAGPGSLVDLSHASTDVACAGFVPAMRAPAMLDAAVATALSLPSLPSMTSALPLPASPVTPFSTPSLTAPLTWRRRT